jgi:hypothetical protein
VFENGETVTKVVRRLGAKDPFVAYVQTTSRHCLERGVHSSNHVFFEITLQHFTARCHDSECTKRHVRSAPADDEWKEIVFPGYDDIPVAALGLGSSSGTPRTWKQFRMLSIEKKRSMLHHLNRIVGSNGIVVSAFFSARLAVFCSAHI